MSDDISSAELNQELIHVARNIAQKRGTGTLASTVLEAADKLHLEHGATKAQALEAARNKARDEGVEPTKP